MIPEYAIFWFLGGLAVLGWPVALFLGVSNFARLKRLERQLRGNPNA